MYPKISLQLKVDFHTDFAKSFNDTLTVNGKTFIQSSKIVYLHFFLVIKTCKTLF